jgi:hypothetical protein
LGGRSAWLTLETTDGPPALPLPSLIGAALPAVNIALVDVAVLDVGVVVDAAPLSVAIVAVSANGGGVPVALADGSVTTGVIEVLVLVFTGSTCGLTERRPYVIRSTRQYPSASAAATMSLPFRRGLPGI